MAAYRLALREQAQCANAALQPLTRESAIACGLRLALTHWAGSEGAK
jgi:hypothetical protein